MALANASLDGGFQDAVFESQAVFRGLMDAMSRPGTIQTLETPAKAPGALSAAQSAILLCLADPDTSVWLSPSLYAQDALGWISFHSGAPVTHSMSNANFAFLGLGEALPDFLGFANGTQEYPDRSTTIIIELPALTGGQALVAAGPGIENEIDMSPSGLPDNFVRRWSANHGLFPRGVDLIFTCGSTVMCLPRSTQLKQREV
ncbi:phosphonate C-P lyase system protein PhnH [Rhizobium sp. L1K21]|uniref:phosphonate C-P lyase system protein PhnH n=1 Tax=Rhizobium sp. L1K21 TaxID=2954933 RepID=UPI002093B8B3|nr:phosphonate C-P lyase system protein PhnH [Rhizobium sp. L1K21]MCO6184644.1 phosphonate C-P lyase system protein PhnH [Rhizobium sp. L1K21]